MYIGCVHGANTNHYNGTTDNQEYAYESFICKVLEDYDDNF